MARQRPLKWLAGGIVGAFGDARVRALLALTGTLIALATLFYRWVEGWGWLDALFFSVVTISTVGYGELVPATVAGKVFTMIYIFLGIGLFVAAAGALGDHLIRKSRGVAGEADDSPEDASQD